MQRVAASRPGRNRIDRRRAWHCMLAALASTALGSSSIAADALATAGPIDGLQGADAIKALGVRLAGIAEQYGLTDAQFESALRDDTSLWLVPGDRFVWVDAVRPEEGASASGAATGVPLEDAFLLETDPGAQRTIYLDFDGHHSQENSWGHDIVFPSYDRNGDSATFSDDELEEIIAIWKYVAEDFAPFGVNVTTLDPGIDALTKTGPSDQTYGIRCLMTQATGGFGNGIGGIAFLGSFNDLPDNPCFVFNKGHNNGSMTASHEVGHSLGLFHDGLFGQTYHPGTGEGPTSWGPIMGAPFGKSLVQWSRGDYEGATNMQNDLLAMQVYIPIRPDDHAEELENATPLNDACELSLGATGIIGDEDDVDAFVFAIGAGDPVEIAVTPADPGPNLDVIIALMDAQGAPLTMDNPADDVIAGLSIPLDPGTYYLLVGGIGKAGVYSDYGSLGQFTVSVAIPACACAEDVDGDGAVDVGDLLAVLAAWGPCDACAEDVNGDGVVAVADVLGVLAAWGSCTG